ncbi:hypothetical protein DMC63_40165 [Streptomyces sp. WAC 05977]|nr:hypothetical protein DMC63_40165 [Streptomyces sp. WAC 05977]
MPVTGELVSNANRHGDAPRACRLELRDEGERLLIEVDDSCRTSHAPHLKAAQSCPGQAQDRTPGPSR